ncbi:MAG TPA: tripartite tricarboxylate transporter substrate binding protein [Burkholderiales bacterium]|nr:tripartite tricarboxylate transporter substrate binding protein [Burkholderiales bacterium]
MGLKSRSAGAALLLGLFTGFAALIATEAAFAQDDYPSRALRMVVDTSPGGLTDILGRMAAEGLARELGRQVVVENKAGASGNVAIEYVVKSPPDGYTLMICAGGNLVIKPFLDHSLVFDPLSDLTPVFNVAEAPHILVVPAVLPVKDLAGFIAYAKANPGKVYYGSAGTGSPPHLAADQFARLAGLQLVHVPYKGVGPALPDLIAGRLQIMSMSYGSARPHLKSGALKALAAGSKRRLAGLPEVPTAAEAGLPAWEMSAWFGIFAPRDTSPEIVRTLNAKLQNVIDDPSSRQRLLEIGAEPLGGPAPVFAERVRADYRLWGQVVRDSGIKLE